jgi:geranylgeranyl diphosphate synthase, type II
MTLLPRFFAEYQHRIDGELRRVVPGSRDRVQEAMAYAVHAPAKRIRPVLTMLTAELCGGSSAGAMSAACSIEMIHAASLILDDLPVMDDSPLRRGKPATHVAFGEAMALLAAFGLLSGAFSAIARGYEPPLGSRIAALLSDAVGAEGLIGGQAADLLATDQQITFETLERIHRGKTGALFSAAATAGAMTADAADDSIAALQAFAKNLGLAFQIIDDLLDVEGDPAITGKPVREDAKKTTFVSFSGPEGARQLATELCHTADRALQPFGRRAERLRELSAFVAARMS